MEIEQPEEIKNKNVNSNDEEITKEEMKYLTQLLGIQIKPEELQLFKDMNNTNNLINSIKFSDKKKNEIRDSISNEIKNIQNKESLEKMSEEKTKKFSEIMKLNGKTTVYHTAEKDELSETMHAFYFCDKTKQIFSDKQAAEYKAMHFDTTYEIPLHKGFGLRDDDNLSSYSNLKSMNNQADNFYNDTKLTKKKRKLSNNKTKSNKKRIKEKISISDEYNNNSKNGEGMANQEAEYCIPKCKYGRKSRNQPMIMCDKCREWYHTKCLSFTNEQFQKYNGKGKTWYCPKCNKMDIDDNKIFGE